MFCSVYLWLYPQNLSTNVNCGPNPVPTKITVRWTIDVSGARMSQVMPFGFIDITAWIVKKKEKKKKGSTECHILPILLASDTELVVGCVCFYDTVANALLPPLLFQCWCYNLKPLFFEWMQAVLSNSGIRVTMATAFCCWGLEKKRKISPKFTVKCLLIKPDSNGYIHWMYIP